MCAAEHGCPYATANRVKGRVKGAEALPRGRREVDYYERGKRGHFPTDTFPDGWKCVADVKVRRLVLRIGSICVSNHTTGRPVAPPIFCSFTFVHRVIGISASTRDHRREGKKESPEK